MVVISNASVKKCATCQHFNGTRDTDVFKKNVRYEVACKGTCLLTKQSKTANSGICSKWTKWATLK